MMMTMIDVVDFLAGLQFQLHCVSLVSAYHTNFNKVGNTLLTKREQKQSRLPTASEACTTVYWSIQLTWGHASKRKAGKRVRVLQARFRHSFWHRVNGIGHHRLDGQDFSLRKRRGVAIFWEPTVLGRVWRHGHSAMCRVRGVERVAIGDVNRGVSGGRWEWRRRRWWGKRLNL